MSPSSFRFRRSARPTHPSSHARPPHPPQASPALTRATFSIPRVTPKPNCPRIRATFSESSKSTINNLHNRQHQSSTDNTSSKSASSRSFPNLSRFVHVHHRHHAKPHPHRIPNCSSSNPLKAPPPSSKNVRKRHHSVPQQQSSQSSSVSHHTRSHSRNRNISRPKSTRSLLSPSRTVSLDFIPRLRRPSDQRKITSATHRKSTQASDSTPTCPPNVPNSILLSDLNPRCIAKESPSLDVNHDSTEQGPNFDCYSVTQSEESKNSAMQEVCTEKEVDEKNELSSTSLSPHSTESAATNTAPNETVTQKRLMRSIGSSHNIRRLSLGHRGHGHSRNVRSTSFGDVPRGMWASGSLFAQRLSSDQGPSRSTRFGRVRNATDLRSLRWKRASYSYSDFPRVEEDLVEIGDRLPDRLERTAGEDVFGRRRGDLVIQGESLARSSGQPVLACQDEVGMDSKRTLQVQMQQQDKEKDKLRQLSAQQANKRPISEKIDRPKPLQVRSVSAFGSDTMSKRPPLGGKTRFSTRGGTMREIRRLSDMEGVEEEETMKNIAKAMESSKGRLRKSANMSNAFRAVIRAGDGFVRKSDLIQATLNSGESKDASMIILLEPDCFDGSGTSGTEGISCISDESGSADIVRGGRKLPSLGTGIGFSTSMTAKQCAATLETILREMTCKVVRSSEGMEDGRYVIRLRLCRGFNDIGRMLDRKVRVLVIIREEDRIRTSVSFRRVGGLYASREAHVPLCTEIRDRFQREWPAVVEALYIRLPSMTVSGNT